MPLPELKNFEIRNTNLEFYEFQFEKRDDDNPARLIGYAAVFNKLSEPLFGFRERIAQGAFTNSLKKPDDVRALVDHDPSRIIGRNIAGTLKLEENSKGLKTTIKLPDTTVGRDIAVNIERGDISGMSIGFQTITDEWNMEDGQEIRTLKEVKLFDVSVVTYPAYPDTSVAVRSLELWKKQVQEQAPEKVAEKMRMKLELDLCE